MLLQVDGLTSHYGRIQVLHAIDLAVAAGELVALVGGNGAGKTTLLRCLSGVQPATGGTIRYDGRDISRMAPDRRVRAGIAQVPERRLVFAPMSVHDNLLMGGYTRPRREVAEDLERMYALFPELYIRRRQAAGTLSGGQQQMLAMSRALMARPRLLLLDEPSLGLAPNLVADVFATIESLKRDGVTILLVEQNAHAALAIADRGYVLETGRVALTAPGPALLADDAVQKAYLGI